MSGGGAIRYGKRKKISPAALTAQQAARGLSAVAVTPGELNRIFTEAGVYNESGDIVWGRIREALPETEVLAASGVDNRKLDRLLSEGRFPAVKVKNHGHGAWHWVLLAFCPF